MTKREFEGITGSPLERFAYNCHAASAALVKSGKLGPCRVARGSCRGVPGQHSWVVLGMDAYDPLAEVIDATLWSYDSSVKGVWTGRADERPHRPHGSGSIWEWGKPSGDGGEPIVLEAELSDAARDFLALLGPLDRKGWMYVANAPVEGWPSAEIIAAMYDDPRLCALVPIDIVGMLTDRNPGGLYLPEEAAA